MTPECRQSRELADAFLSDQLLVETTHEITRHLDGCPACRAEFEARRRLRTALKSAFAGAPELQPRAQFAAALRARLIAEAEAPGADQSAALAPRVPAWRLWGAIAASLLLVAGLGVAALSWLAPSQLAALARLAVGDHENCALTYRLAEKPITLEQAARDYDAAFRSLETVEPLTTALPGGPLEILARHSCVWEGVRFAHLVLRYKETIVSVVVASDASAAVSWIPWSSVEQASLDASPVAGKQVASFRGAAHTVFVVSSLSADDVQAVAQVMAQPILRALAGA